MPTHSLPVAPTMVPPVEDVLQLQLLRLKQEAEEEKRLRTALSKVSDVLLKVDELKKEYNCYSDILNPTARRLIWGRIRELIPNDDDLVNLKENRKRLEAELAQAEQRVATELAAIQPHKLTAPGTANRPARVNRKVVKLLAAGIRVLNDYSSKLDRLVSSALTVSDHNRNDRLRDILLNSLGSEFRAISEPLRWWIRKLSAVHEEGRVTEIQRMDLQLRLSELEVKFQTATLLLNHLNVL